MCRPQSKLYKWYTKVTAESSNKLTDVSLHFADDTCKLVHFAADEGPQSETFCFYGPLNYVQITLN